MSKKLSSADFVNRVIKEFTLNITDNVFLYIQNDEELRDLYLDAISASDRKTINSLLGKAIANRFEVDNVLDDEGETVKGEPTNFLIKTKYTKHEK